VGKLGFADRDGAGWRTRERRLERDLRFLEKVRACQTVDNVRTLRREQSAPICQWRHVALLRALKRVLLNGVK